MMMFKTTDGGVELHGGYMHTSDELEENSAMWNVEIDAIVFHNNPRSVVGLVPAFRRIKIIIYRK